MDNNILFDYLSKHFCPHDIIHTQSYAHALSWTNDKCERFHELYPDKCCTVCWDCFITEVLRDEEDL